MKAYVVSDDEYCTIEFAEHRATAQASGANELNSEFPYVRCRRAPEFDQYAEARKVPWKVLIEEHGWSQECGFCYKRVYSDEEGRVYNDGEDQAYCNSECMHKAKEQEAKYLEMIKAL
ncbi:hypothetical protein [Pseudomonas phage vB_PsaM_M1]|nr:hypothetical protein [Pseudomonas phage vB_PsaM_M1]